jgi:cell division protein ZapA
MADSAGKSITVLIAGRPYQLKIHGPDEASFRSVVRMVNEKVGEYQDEYPNRDKQDCLAMTALFFAVLARKEQLIPPATDEDPEVSEKLQQLDDLLDELTQ